MKKRKELDALVANGKLGRNIRKTKKGQHELLRSETDSSEIEEFSILTPRKNNLRKAGPSRLCSAFVPVCVFILVAACGVCSGALIWMHFNLRTDLDVVRDHLQKVESNNKGLPEEFHLIDTRIKVLEANQSVLVIELRKLSANVSSIIKQIGLLNQTTGSLQQSIAAAPEIKSLPNDVKTLMQDYANMGSNIAELQDTVRELKEKQKNYDADKNHLNSNLKKLEDEMGEIKSHSDIPSNSPVTTNSYSTTPLINIPPPTNMALQIVLTNYIHEEVNRISTSLDFLNATITPKLVFISDDMHRHHVEIEELKNSTNIIQTKLSQQEAGPLTSPTVDKLKLNLQDYVYHLIEEKINSSSFGIDSSTLLLLKDISENIRILKQQYNKIKYEEENNPFIGVNGSLIIQEYINTALENVSLDHMKKLELLKETVEHIHLAFTSQQNTQVEMKSQIGAILHLLDRWDVNHTLSHIGNMTSLTRTENNDENSSYFEFVPASSPIPLFEKDDIQSTTQKNLKSPDNVGLDLAASILEKLQTKSPPIFTSPLPVKTRSNVMNRVFSENGNLPLPQKSLEELEKQLTK